MNSKYIYGVYYLLYNLISKILIQKQMKNKEKVRENSVFSKTLINCKHCFYVNSFNLLFKLRKKVVIPRTPAFLFQLIAPLNLFWNTEKSHKLNDSAMERF